MNNLIKSDLYRYEGKTGHWALIKTFIKTPGFRFTFFLRKVAKTNIYNPLRLFYYLLYRHYSIKYGFQIHYETQIGQGLYLGHFGMVVVNKRAIIGSNCNLSHGITIGQVNRGKLKGCPIIGNNVWIGTGCVIVGNIKIGDNVLIAPNTYVNMEIPSNSIVRGNPPQIIYNENATDFYVENILN